MHKDHLLLLQKMICLYEGDPRRIQHFLKVYNFASLLGHMEHLPEQTQYLLETAAIVHDIGIKASEAKYGSSAGKYQELEGPDISREMLREAGLAETVIERVAYLVGHHHTYNIPREIDYQLLVEADFLVNAYEDTLSLPAIKALGERIFRSASGKQLLQTIYQN
jgi:CRISPR/Cas system-associated endonuclease Cas3-HD